MKLFYIRNNLYKIIYLMSRLYKYCNRSPCSLSAMKKYIRYINGIEYDIDQLRNFVKQYDHENIVHRTVGMKFGITNIKRYEIILSVLTDTEPQKYNIDSDIEYWIFLLLLIQKKMTSIKLTFGDGEFGNYVITHYDKLIFK